MTPSIRIHDLSTLTDADRAALLQRTENDLSYFLERVPAILEAVRTEGDEALARFAREFDKAPVNADDIAVTKADLDAAFASLDPQMLDTMRYAADNIRRYHQAQMPGEMWMKEVRPGVLVGERFTPIDSVALYSPRGKGSFPSVTLMTAIPAVVAGVKSAIILTPPGPDGRVDPATLVAARLSGIDKVFKAGGAQAVAAAAFGTPTIPRCLKIEGPGSPWFMAAKQRLHGKIYSRLPAGPSESLVFVDETSSPRLAALDLLVESEHGADSSVFLVTWSRTMAEAVCAAIPEFWAEMSPQRVEYSQAVLGGGNGGIILAGSREEAYRFVNDYAPEHLQILCKAPFEHLPHIRNASEILLGEQTAGAIANYMMGPNCVLPTSGAAKVHSPLGVHDFLKSSSIGHMTLMGYAEMAPHTHRFATYEGFDAHANSVSDLRT